MGLYFNVKFSILDTRVLYLFKQEYYICLSDW